MPRPESSQLKVIFAFLTIYIVWGTTFLGIRIAVETIPPFMMAATRFILAGGMMLPILLLRGVKFPKLLHWRSALVIGGLMLVGGNGLLSFAEQRIPSALAALVVATMPMWVALLEWLVFNGERPNNQTAIGLLIGFAGVALLFAPGPGVSFDMVAILIVLVATVFWAVGALYSRRAPLPEQALMGSAAEMLAGGLLLSVVSLATGEWSHFDLATISLPSGIALLYLTVLGSIVAYTAYIWLMKTVEPAKVNTNFYVNPVIAVFAGGLIGGEEISPRMLAATAIILLGVVVVTARLPALRQMAPRNWARLIRKRKVTG